MTHKAFTTGCLGLELNDEERAFLRDEKPWGFILFARNVDNPDQVKKLTADFGECVGVENPPVLVDQEGGRVQRMRPPHWTNYPPASAFGELYESDPQKGLRATWLLSRLHAFDLLPLGININCLPVLDIPSADGHDVIGNRAYGRTPEQVIALGQAACDGLKAGGVMPVIKHMPGHGRATGDSHMVLPQVDADRATLEEIDFKPFAVLANEPMAMTAHIVFSDIDPRGPATTSTIMINDIIREQLGFDNLLMSDDVSMEALSGDFAERSRAIFEAGCDIVLHCHGIMEEMKAVASVSPQLAGKPLERATRAMSGAGQTDDMDEAEARSEFEELMSDLAVA